MTPDATDGVSDWPHWHLCTRPRPFVHGSTLLSRCSRAPSCASPDSDLHGRLRYKGDDKGILKNAARYILTLGATVRTLLQVVQALQTKYFFYATEQVYLSFHASWVYGVWGFGGIWGDLGDVGGVWSVQKHDLGLFRRLIGGSLAIRFFVWPVAQTRPPPHTYQHTTSSLGWCRLVVHIGKVKSPRLSVRLAVVSAPTLRYIYRPWDPVFA